MASDRELGVRRACRNCRRVKPDPIAIAVPTRQAEVTTLQIKPTRKPEKRIPNKGITRAMRSMRSSSTEISSMPMLMPLISGIW